MLHRREMVVIPDDSHPRTQPVVLYVSPLLEHCVASPDRNRRHQCEDAGAAGLRHGFSTRLGGVSTGPFASLNVGNPNGEVVQDSNDNLAANHDRLFRAAGFVGPIEHCRVHQVHGTEVVRVSQGVQHNPHAKADAVISDDPSRVISVRVADCVPILLSNPSGALVAAVHAGWRGVVAGIVPKVIALMAADERHSTDPSCLFGAIGPCIGRDAFEVGPEVAREFAKVFGPTEFSEIMRPGAGDRSHVDLRGAIVRQMLASGMNRGGIDSTDRCTHRDTTEFYSHRRDNGLTGRMMAFISARWNAN